MTDKTYWAELAELGARNALAGLSHMVLRAVDVASHRSLYVPAGEIADALRGARSDAIATHLTLEDDAATHMLVLHEPDAARALVDLLMMRAPGATEQLGEVERSALAEVGNVVAAHFLNALSDAAEVPLLPSTPSLVSGARGELLNVVAGPPSPAAGKRLVVHSTFRVADAAAALELLVMPSEALFRTVLAPRAHAA